MKQRLLIVIAVLFFKISFAQDLMIHGASPNIYLTHTVQPKENWYSVGRVYNVSPKEIAPANGLTMDKPLSIGQQLKVPLTIANFSQDGQKASDEVFVPVYHIVQEKEWMSRISNNYNKVAIASIEQWNSIKADNAKAGTKLIVGYLKVKKDQSALAAKGSATLPKQKAVVVTNTDKKVEPSPMPSKDVPVKSDVVKTEPVKTEPVKKDPVTSTSTTAEKPVITQPVSNPAATANVNFNGGYFKSQFEEAGKSNSGNAGIFKSTSGWKDGKYYALMNNVPVGTIVKISNPGTSKAVYAKVLGQLPDMKESVGLAVRISDAAAAELGAGASRFNVAVNY